MPLCTDRDVKDGLGIPLSLPTYLVFFGGVCYDANMKSIKYVNGKLYSQKGSVMRELKAKSLCNGRRYVTIRIGGRKGKTVYAHRHIWEMFNGSIPKGYVIDHKNGDSLDNRIENLQCITQRENCEKQKMRTDNKSGQRGIYFCNTRKQHVVDFTRSGVRRMRRFKTMEEAAGFLLTA